MIHITSFTFLVFLIAMSTSCCTSKNYKIIDNDNASLWINRVKIPSSPISVFDGEELTFSIMPEEKKNEYITRLEEVQYIELNCDEYFILTKNILTKKYGFAIRAVYPHLGGHFTVDRNEKNEYYVHYLVMGSRVWEYNKAVLIIEADEFPKEIFNGYTVVK